VNLLLFNLAMDETHPTLAFGIGWVERLARRFDHIEVVTMRAGPHRVPANVTVRSAGHEHGWSKPRRALVFYAAVLAALRARRIHVVFAHMNWVFALMFAPLGRLIGLRTLLWYAHGAVPPGLRLADRLVDRVATSTAEGYRLPSAKRRILGQGADLAPFLALSIERAPQGPLVVATVSRLAPSKGVEHMLRALADVPGGARPWRFLIAGEGTTAEERAYEARVRALARDLGLADRVEFLGRLEPAAVSRVLGQAHVMLNLSATGSLDKALLEAMAAGCLVISSNDAYRALATQAGAERWAIARDGAAAALAAAAALDEPWRQAIAGRLRQTARPHDIGALTDRLFAELGELARGD
jgi:glycosyltransferase involved in cell wall biosynthesis